MMLGVIAFTSLLTWMVTTWTLRQHFDEIGRAIIADDLAEYAEIYERRSVGAVERLFVSAGHGELDQGIRLLDPSGKPLIDRPIPNPSHRAWPEFTPHELDGSAEIDWHRLALGNGAVMTIGRNRLADGSELWFARTNEADLEAIQRIHNLLLIAIGVSVILSIGPVVWFANRVLHPVQVMIGGARRLASSPSLEERLVSSAAIPELRDFANAFNDTLDRIQTLTEELEAANDQLAHELRTPLARIRGNVERILSAENAGNDVIDHAVKAVEEIARASSIISEILSIRAGDSGIMRLNPESLSPGSLMKETVELYSASAEEKGISLTLISDESLPPLVADRQRLLQAVCNLIDNAIAYTPSGGAVEVEVHHEAESGSFILHVRDTGPGVSPSDAQRIWHRFMRGSASSAAHPGIGLGLSLVRAVATAHRGEAGVDNRPGGGADFWIRLPAAGVVPA